MDIYLVKKGCSFSISIPGSDNMIPWTPDIPDNIPPAPRDPDPWMDPFYPGWRGMSPGSSITSGSMMSAGYNDPNYGLPSDGGGAFTGTGAAPTCIMPAPMQPSVPVGGLFGPDAFMSFWGNPGYDTPPNMSMPSIILPVMPVPNIGLERARELLGGMVSGSPGTTPSIGQSSLSSIGTMSVQSESEVIATRYGKYARSYFGPWRVKGPYIPSKRSKHRPGKDRQGNDLPEGGVEVSGGTTNRSVEYVDGKAVPYNKKGEEGRAYQRGEQAKYEREARRIVRDFVIDVIITIATCGIGGEGAAARAGLREVTEVGERSLGRRIGAKLLEETGEVEIETLLGPLGRGIKTLTRGSFRRNLIKQTGEELAGYEAHHVLPRTLESKFARLGINIHDPRFGAWVEANYHKRTAYAYNKVWRKFLNGDHTQEDVINFARKISKEYKIKWF